MSFIDDVTFAMPGSTRSKKEQAKNGLRLGIGAGAFMIGGMLLGSGLRSMMSSVPPHHLVWADWVAWVEICTALLLLLLTTRVWLLLVGYFVFLGCGCELVVLISGKALDAPHRPIPRVETSATVLFLLATLMLLFRFVDIRPSILDRVALTFYVLAVTVWLVETRAASTSTFLDPWPMAGLSALAISWCVYRWNKTKPRTPEAQFSR